VIGLGAAAGDVDALKAQVTARLREKRLVRDRLGEDATVEIAD